MTKQSKADGITSAPPKYLSFLSGGIAGAIEASATYPLEFAKTRIQLRRDPGNATIATVANNPIRMIRDVLRKEGPRALYRGCSALVVGSVVKDGVRFFTFDAIKSAFKDPETGNLSPFRSVLAGMSAGVMSSTFASTPTERVKTALIDDARSSKRFRSARDAVRIIYYEQGFLGMYRGFLGTTLRQSCSTAIRMGTYNILKDYETSHHIGQGLAANFINGAIAGLITTVGTQPFDVIKTRSQSSKGATTAQAFRSILADEGIAGLWKGTSTRLARTVLSAGILFTTYERTMEVLQLVANQVINNQG
ncbi:hypothetical protein M8818_002458 [Zalaria obscura]|uniref:Uncharacterized protein n=1 Tax=Zalaria obscura TaxID=2024903 RepID=A0ACC3SHU4_9PEZI